MYEIKSILKNLVVRYVLILTSIISVNIITDGFPFYNYSTIWMLVLSVVLMINYNYHVVERGNLKLMMKLTAGMMILLVFLRGLKYSAFVEIDVIARHLWYLYYVPVLFLPQFFFFAAVFVNSNKNGHFSKKCTYMVVITVIFICIVLTNDTHQLVFRFNKGFEGWDREYTYGICYFLITVWQYIFYLAAVITLVLKCRVSSAKKYAWIILVPFATGVVMLVMLITDKMIKLNGMNIIQFPETICFMVAGVLEVCMKLGFIPTNQEYSGLMKISSLAVQITDSAGEIVYKSDNALELKREHFLGSKNMIVEKNMTLHKMKIPGGFAFWQNDITELNRLNEELAEVKERLSEESELNRLINNLKEKQVIIEQRTEVYDRIANQTQSQSLAISKLALEAKMSDNLDVQLHNARLITFYGAYIKRYANLILLSTENTNVSIGELGLAIAESLRYLNQYGLPGEMFITASSNVSAERTLACYEIFEKLIEENITSLKGVYVHLLEVDNQIRFKLTLEGANVFFSESIESKLRRTEIKLDVEYEDDVTYICFTFSKGGNEIC